MWNVFYAFAHTPFRYHQSHPFSPSSSCLKNLLSIPFGRRLPCSLLLRARQVDEFRFSFHWISKVFAQRHNKIYIRLDAVSAKEIRPYEIVLFHKNTTDRLLLLFSFFFFFLRWKKEYLLFNTLFGLRFTKANNTMTFLSLRFQAEIHIMPMVQILLYSNSRLYSFFYPHLDVSPSLLPLQLLIVLNLNLSSLWLRQLALFVL